MDLKLDKAQFPQPEWPAKPHKVGQSLCHWFDLQARKPFTELIQNLPPNPVLVEFGTFLGAGSTMVALTARADLQVICLDHWKITGRLASRYNPQNSMDKRNNLCAFLRGEGTALQHCQNNLFAFRDRVTLVEVKTLPRTVDALAAAGVKPNCVLLDDDHNKNPFLNRLRRCRACWPDALIVCDDYCQPWQGVIDGVQEAFRENLYSRSESQLIGNRMMTFKRNSNGE